MSLGSSSGTVLEVGWQYKEDMTRVSKRTVIISLLEKRCRVDDIGAKQLDEIIAARGDPDLTE